LEFVEARTSFERADRALADRRGRPLSDSIFPQPAFRDEDRKRQQAALTETEVAQPALGATGMALFHLLGSLGVEPQMVAGHSYGEFVALCAAGCFSEEDLARLSEARGRFIREGATGDAGAMAAVEAGPEDLQPLLTDPALTLANLNAPRQTVISGPRGDIERALQWCTSRGMPARLLPVSCAFHSPLVAPAQRQLAGVLSQLALRPPRLPVFSNTTAGLYPESPAEIVALLGEHLVRPVRFVAEIDAMYQAGARLFVEVGPRSVLSGLVGQILHDRPHVCVSLDQPGRHGLTQLLHGLARLVTEGVPLRFERLYRGREVRRLDLSALEKETGKVAHSPTTWLVNGGRARPIVPLARPIKPAPPPAPRAGEESSMSRVVRPSDDEPVGSSGIAPRVPVGGRNGHRAAEVLPDSSRLQPSRPSVGASGHGTRPGTVSPPRFEVVPRHHRPTADRGELIPMHNGSQSLTMNGARAMPPASTGEHATDMLRQFQHVMQCFLRTQEVVMHDLTMAFLGTRNGAPPAMGHDLRLMPPATTNGGPLHLGESYPPIEVMPPPPVPDGPSRSATARPVPVSPPGNGENGHGAIAPPRPREAAPHREREGAVEEAPPLPTSLSGTATIDIQAVTERLLAVVSERTGYPTDMLSLDADLEADLGIDSIKRVEISGTVVRSLDLP
ncbi:MAG TPA: acyltransferase domain-containing protein, partial [Isosphaeraceae bacterium]